MKNADRHLLFSGTGQPAWAPRLAHGPDFSNIKISKKYLRLKDSAAGESSSFYVVDDFLGAAECQALIAQFDATVAEPVGVDGYAAAQDKDSIGSYRTNAWTVELARQLEPRFQRVLADEAAFKPAGAEVFQNLKQEKMAIPVPPHELFLCGPTPYMRFMKYYAGGKHAPHYDALYTDTPNRYVTLMSWVIYLNTPTGSGGAFQFVEDGQGAVPPSKRDRSDWRRMAAAHEVIESVSPQRGRLLIFPHWLPHQVGLYEAQDGSEASRRIIIRGDLAYGWD